MNNLNEKFNNQSIEIIKNAISLAINEGKIVKPKHILISLINQKRSIAANLLKQLHLEEKTIKEIKNEVTDLSSLEISKEAEIILTKAVIIASNYRHKYIGAEHLLAGILDLNDAEINNLLIQGKVNITFLKNNLKAIFEAIANFPAFCFSEDKDNENFPIMQKNSFIKTHKKEVTKKIFSSNFCVDLTEKNFQQDIDPVISRDKEISRLIQILCRRYKNNPVLIGEAGVGKTAIVEGLAKKIINNEVPAVLSNKKILSLDINALVAGTIFRGEFEARLKNLMNKLSNNESIIVFIDEIHNIVGAGSSSGTLDVANILKPILAKGKIKFIGATTLDEYKKHIEKDSALERRFQPIIIKEPSVEDAIKILNGIKENYEKFHKINIDNEAIEWAVKLSNKYIQDRLLPDKAIDLIDETAAQCRLEQKSNDPINRIKIMEDKLLKIIQYKEESVLKEKFEAAMQCKKEEEILREKIELLKNDLKNLNNFAILTKKDIYKTVAKILNISEKDIIDDNISLNIAKLNKKIKTKIIAQDEIIEKICNALKRNFAGISSPNRPIGSFLFLGPSGVGKTELAKTLAYTLFQNKKSLIRVDMNEYSEPFNISKLIGAPAGYIGFEQGGMLTEKVRKNPYSVILFDELEKAHKSLFNLLLQILEEGHITDASGRMINFRNTLIIMTSNLNINELNKQAYIGFTLKNDKEKLKFNHQYNRLKENLLKKINEILSSEFLSRIDDILIFNPLKAADIERIVHINLKEISERLFEQKIDLSFNKKAINYLAKKSISYERGARQVRKTIQENVEDLLAEKIINKEIKKGDRVCLKTANGKIEIEKL